MNTNGRFRIEQGAMGDGTLDENYLYNARLSNPHLNTVLYHTIPYKRWGFSRLLGQLGNVIDISKNGAKGVDSFRYIWSVQGTYRPDVRLAKPIAGTNVGLNMTTFTICLDMGFFQANDIIMFPSGEQMTAQIISGPVAVGANYEYVVKLISAGDYSKCLNPSDQLQGGLIVPMGNAQPEGSFIGGHNVWMSPDQYDAYLTIARKHFKTTRSATQSVTWITDTNVEKKYGKGYGRTWLPTAMWMNMEMWYAELEFYHMFGQRNIDVNGNVYNDDYATGNKIRMGGGIQEQLGTANNFTYSSPNQFSAGFLEDIMAILNQRSVNMENNQWLLIGGYKAKELFHKAITAAIGANSNLVVDGATFIDKNGNSFAYSQNFTTYHYLGNTFKFMRCDTFDDRKLWGGNMDSQGFPLKSYEMWILDLGELKASDTKANLQMLYRGTGTDSRHMEWQIPGSIAIDGNPGPFRASSYDGAEYHFLMEAGVVLHTVETCGRIIPSFNSNIIF